MTMTFNLSN